MAKGKIITVPDISIFITLANNHDYICLTDMANAKQVDSRAADTIKNWLRTRYTLEFLGTWEQINNTNFKVVEFEHFKTQAGLPSFVLSVSEWIEKTNAIGITVKKGKYGGTYAHRDIALECGSAISASFKLYLIKEFQRLKEEENDRLQLNWNLQRTLDKVNYRIHTDAIKEISVPKLLAQKEISLVYANEADILNMALFGKTAQQWRDENPSAKGNIRNKATIEQLVVLSNMESINSVLIHNGLAQAERLTQLNKMAITQMKKFITKYYEKKPKIKYA
jgi:hypothetical protein